MFRQSVKPKKKYKNEDAWLDAIYRKNKEFIVERLHNPHAANTTSPKTQFKQLFREYRAEGYTPTKAIDALEKSSIFTEAKDRLKSNAYAALKKDKEAYQQFRDLTKDERGRYTSIDINDFSYEDGTYVYKNLIVVDFTNSPQEIVVRKI